VHKNSEKIVVLGAGLAGLGFARSLPKASVFEAKDHPGGHAFSHDVDGCFFDEGAHISHTQDSRFLKLIYEQAGQVHQIAPSRVSNYWNGRWVTYPVQNHLYELPLKNRIPALLGLMAAHARPKRSLSNYADWCKNQYGNYLSHHFYGVFTQKYWRMEMEELSVDWVEGRLIKSFLKNVVLGALMPQGEKQASFRRFHYPASGGFFGFFKPLYRTMKIHYGERAVEVDSQTKRITFESGRTEHYDALASSIPLPELIGIIKDVPSSVAEAAHSLKHTKLLCVNMVVNRPRLTPLHWCYIYDHDVEAARVSFPSNLSPGGVREGLSTLQAEIFRRFDEDWDTEALSRRTIRQMADLFGFDKKSELISVKPISIPYAYVISDKERERSVSHILTWLKKKDVVCMGFYGKWKHKWSDAAYSSGLEAAREISQLLCLA